MSTKGTYLECGISHHAGCACYEKRRGDEIAALHITIAQLTAKAACLADAASPTGDGSPTWKEIAGAEARVAEQRGAQIDAMAARIATLTEELKQAKSLQDNLAKAVDEAIHRTIDADSDRAVLDRRCNEFMTSLDDLRCRELTVDLDVARTSLGEAQRELKDHQGTYVQYLAECQKSHALTERAEKAERDLAEVQRGFDLRWDADQRAIKRWREDKPGRELMWPDHADLCCWLLARDTLLTDRAEKAERGLTEASRDVAALTIELRAATARAEKAERDLAASQDECIAALRRALTENDAANQLADALRKVCVAANVFDVGVEPSEIDMLNAVDSMVVVIRSGIESLKEKAVAAEKAEAASTPAPTPALVHSPDTFCDIPANGGAIGFAGCDMPWGHGGDMHANRGDGYYNRSRLDEHHERQRRLAEANRSKP